MAYGLKYELWCASKDSLTYKLRLLFDGYTGAEINRDIPADAPLVLRKDKSEVIRGTSCEFAIREIVDFEMDEFYSNNPKKIKAELYQGATLIWSGYNLPQQYQAEYVPAPLNIRFTATDGLGLLKNEPFNLTERNSQLATIIYCIDKIGLGLSYSIAVNLFETNHVHDRSPLAQTYEDAACYGGKFCNEVIEDILSKYDAEITQVNNLWYITRSCDKKSARMLYSPAGVYTGVDVAPAVLNLGYKGAGIQVWPVGRLGRAMEPGAKKVTLSFDFGRKASLLNNYDFWRFSGGQFESWTQTGSFTLRQDIKEGKAYAFLGGYTAVGNEGISQEIPVTKVTNEDFVFEIDFAAIGSSRTTLSAGSILMTVRMAVALSDGTTTYYLTKAGWSTTPTFIEETVQSSVSSPIWNHIRIITGELPVSGTLHVYLFKFLSGPPGSTYSYNGVAFSEPLVYFLQGGELYPSGLKTVATFNNSTEPGDLGEVKLLTADAPDYENKAQLYKNITRLVDDTLTWLWHVLGETSFYSQVVQMARILASNNRIARQKLTGTIRGSGINLNSIIKHTYNGNREFEISEGQWDIYDATYQVTLLELLAWSAEAITFEDAGSAESQAQSSSGSRITGTVITNDGGGSAVMTGADILAKMLEVDGAGSGLDADLFDGHEGSYYAPLDSPSFVTGIITPALKVTTGAAAGNMLISDADGDLSYLAAGATTKILVGGGAANPVWTEATGTGAPARAGSPTFTGSVKTDSLESSVAFTSGFSGNGYKVIETGGISSLEVDQLTIRGLLKAYELQINKISSVNGGLIISVANAKCIDVIGTALYFDEGIGLTIPFVENDYIKAQQFTGTGVASYLGKIIAVNAGNVITTTISGAPWIGMDLVQLGNSATATRQSAIYLTAADTNNPYIEGHSGITAGVFTDATRKFRLGNLTGITDATLSPSGFGLYAQNVFLSGKIVATDGLIGGFTISPTEGLYSGSGITHVHMKPGAGFWAGANLQVNAPFSVTQAGQLRVAVIGDTIGDEALYFDSPGSTIYTGASGWNLNVKGTLTAQGLLTAVGVHIGGTSNPGADNLVVDGNTTINGTTTFNGAITGTAALNILTVSGAATLNTLSITGVFNSGDIVVGGNLRISSMTTTQRTALSNVGPGRIIYNSTTDQFEVTKYGGIWSGLTTH